MKKKILCIALVVISLLSLMCGCGNDKKDVGVATQPNEPTESITESTQNNETDNENKEENKPVASGEFGSNAGFTGVYSIDGHAILTFGDSRTFTMDLEGVDNQNEGTLDASKTDIPTYIVDFDDFVNLSLTFDDSGLVSWSVVQKETNKDLGHPSQKELEEAVYPEAKYEQIPAGTLPDEILLSKYEKGKTYVFDIPTNHEGFISPRVINDTDVNTVAITVKVGTKSEYKRTYSSKQVIDSNNFNFFSSDNDNGKFYLFVIDTPVKDLKNFAPYVKLSKYQIGEELDFNFEDFVCNDTDKVVVISCDNKTYTLQPYEMIECSWIRDIKIESIG